jgi:hypothetical protein
VEIQEDLRLIEEVLRSRTFARSITLRKLLLYLWEHRNGDISEYAVATDALGRRVDFDSKIDATVRVQIGRLRRSLEKFYAEEGSEHTRRVTIPVGSHQLCFVDVQEIPPPAALELVEAHSASEAPESPPPIVVRPIISAPMGFTILLLLAFCTFSLLRGWLGNNNSGNAQRRDPPLFWKSFLDNGKPMRIVLPAPVFFSVETPNGGSVMIRDILINDPLKWRDSKALVRMLPDQLGTPAVWQGYTVASDTFASLQLARFMDGYGVRTNFSSSADTPQQIIDHENIVALGTKSSLAAYQADLDRLGFQLAVHEARVTDRLSPADHPREFPRIFETGSRQVTPGIVALIPHGKEGTRILLVQGAQTTALIAYLTSEEGMREIADATQKMDTPYFEAVVLCEVNRGTPLQSRLGAIRQFREPTNKAFAQLNTTKQ